MTTEKEPKVGAHIPTLIERQAFVWMQGRLVELLLRYNVQKFGQIFGEQQAPPTPAEIAENPLLARYRELAVVIYLQDELFNHILPRIKRRLSFESPRQTSLQEFPAKGRVDWERTARASWQERPGELPLEVHTHLRRRDFATPENLLTVVTLLEYRQIVQGLLDDEIDPTSGGQNLRHPLNEIVDVCNRELAFLQFAGLLAECEEIVSGYSGLTTEELEAQVTENLLPGSNSAYADLLKWRNQLRSLQLLDLDRTSGTSELQLMLGADPSRDNYLYQLWIFYELGAFLTESGCLLKWVSENNRNSLEFKWGDTTYLLQHDQSIKLLNNQKSTYDYWQAAPGVRPDFYIRRVDGLILEDAADKLIWHEPGYLLDAKYYRPQDTAKAPASPVKRMLADLQLTGERYGALLFAFQENAPKNKNVPNDATTEDSDVATADPAIFATAKPAERLYQVLPRPASAQYIQSDIEVNIWRLQPQIIAQPDLHELFRNLLEGVHATLAKHKQLELKCRGIFLDSLSANGQGELAAVLNLNQRDGRAWSSSQSVDDLLLCPKPHIAPWRVDLVSLDDCCTNKKLCHIAGLAGSRKPQRLARLEDIKEVIKSSRQELGDSEEAIVEAATKHVLLITQRYADLLKPDMRVHLQWLRDKLGSKDIFDNPLLIKNAKNHRETLALGQFLNSQVKVIGSTNFAGPALLFTGTLEEIVRDTVYRANGGYIRDNNGRKLTSSLGTLTGCQYYAGAAWDNLNRAIRRRWKEELTVGKLVHRLTFAQWVTNLNATVEIRNKVAHQASLSEEDFIELVDEMFGGLGGMGVLNGLLLAWQP